MVVVKNYPMGWWQFFFWDAWLAITIQLGLLKKIDSANPNDEIVPCQWMKQIFQVEN